MEIHGVNGQLGPSRIDMSLCQPSQASQASGGQASDADQVNISPAARYLEQLAQLPPVRQDKVDAARSDLDAGRLDTAEKLSVAIDRMLEDILGE